MFKVSHALVVILTLTFGIYSEAQSKKQLTAPTFYIVARGEYSKYSAPIEVKGASNLPPGSRLSVVLSDSIGNGSGNLSEDAIAVLSKDGFFQVALKPRQGKHFKDNMVCWIALNPNGVQQQASVLEVIGKRGELLGIQDNPQVGKMSGENYYLESLTHIP